MSSLILTWTEMKQRLDLNPHWVIQLLTHTTSILFVGSRLKTEDLLLKTFDDLCVGWSCRRPPVFYLVISFFLFVVLWDRIDGETVADVSARPFAFWVGCIFYPLPLFWYFWVSIWTLVLFDYHVMRCIIDLLTLWLTICDDSYVILFFRLTCVRCRVHVAGHVTPILFLIFWGVTSFGGIKARFD